MHTCLCCCAFVNHNQSTHQQNTIERNQIVSHNETEIANDNSEKLLENTTTSNIKPKFKMNEVKMCQMMLLLLLLLLLQLALYTMHNINICHCST